MTRATAYGMSVRGTITSPACHYQGKKNGLLACGVSGTCGTSGSTARPFIPACSYLADIDQQAQERMDTIIQQMAQAQGITEAMKAADPMAWVGRMNNIQACARELVDKEIIYV